MPEATNQAAVSQLGNTQMANTQTTSTASLDKLRQNITAIKEQANILVPKIKAAFEPNGQELGWFKRLAVLGSDATLVNSLKELTNLLADSAKQAYSLLRSPNANVQAQAKSLIASLANAPQVQQLLERAKEIPLVGSAFSYAFKNFISTAENTPTASVPAASVPVETTE